MNNPSLELVNPALRRGPFRAVLFDFDGTLSLIREGWNHLMVQMMAGHLRKLKLAMEGDEELKSHLMNLIMAKNGMPTILQMEEFVSEIRKRGGRPADSWDYLREFLDKLMGMVKGRWEALESGQARAEDWVVPRVHSLLGNLRNRGIHLVVASGTEYDHVFHESHLLRVNEFFPGGINAPRNNDPSFRKAGVISRVLSELNIRGEELLGFGDGMVETAEVKRVGGVAVGVASSEYGSGIGVVNASKRTTLISAGADLIIPDYAQQDELMKWLLDEKA